MIEHIVTELEKIKTALLESLFQRVTHLSAKEIRANLGAAMITASRQIDDLRTEIEGIDEFKLQVSNSKADKPIPSLAEIPAVEKARQPEFTVKVKGAKRPNGSKPANSWTDKEVQIIKEHYHKDLLTDRKAISKIIALTNRTDVAIAHKVRKMRREGEL